jgi:hypothetical protein
MKILTGLGRFLWDFIIGEDWKIAAGVFSVLGAGAVLVAATSLSDTALSLLVGCAILGVATASIIAGALAAARGAAK